MHFLFAILAAGAATATYVEPYQSSAQDYPSEHYQTVASYASYMKRGHEYKPTPTPYEYKKEPVYSSDPAYSTPAPYPSEDPYSYSYSYSFSSSSSSMAPSFIDGTGIGDLDDNLGKLPVRRGEYKKYDPSPYHSESAYPSESASYSYSYSFSSSSSSAPASSSSSAAASGAAGGLSGLGGLLGGLPIKRDHAEAYPTPSPYKKHSTEEAYPTPAPYKKHTTLVTKVRRSAASASSAAGVGGDIPGLGGVLGDLPLN